jgi:carbamoyltransferase
VTEFLGYHSFNGEGKVMGLAPYGEDNTGIRRTLESYTSTGADYDVTDLTGGGIEAGVQKLEDIFDRERKDSPSEFTDWEKDLARVTQELTEEIVCSIVEWHVRQLGISDVCLAGGVALNCKMNKTVEQLEVVDDLFIQPAAHDAGLALGAGMLESTPSETPPMTNAYYGPEYTGEIEPVLEESKLEYEEVDNPIEVTADALADGELVGWYQGRLELGPRALGNRSILADPRTVESRDRVNKYVKHREEWRPFAPSMKEEALDDYLVNATSSPFMIKTYKVQEQKRDEIAAALHSGDETTRPQTVNHEQNPCYYDLLSEFESRTGVPVLLNTSFNDHAEPIVTKPVEAIKDFYGMGLDMLVLGDYVLRK